MGSPTIDEVFHPEFAPARWLHRLADPLDLASRPKAANQSALAPQQAIYIRPFQLEDAGPMYQAARESMDQLAAWMTWCRADFSLSQAETFVSQCGRAWARGEHYSFAIVDAQDGNFLGSVGLNQLNHAHKLGNVGYWVRNAAARRGIATIATRAVVAFGLTELGLNRLEFLIPAVNVASQRVAQKIGAKFEGLLRHRLMIAGQCHDAALYAVTRNDEREAA